MFGPSEARQIRPTTLLALILFGLLAVGFGVGVGLAASWIGDRVRSHLAIGGGFGSVSTCARPTGYGQPIFDGSRGDVSIPPDETVGPILPPFTPRFSPPGYIPGGKKLH